MKNTVRAVIESFRNFLEDRNGRPSSSSYAFPDKLIFYYLTMFRNKIIFDDQLEDSINGLDESIQQTIPCVELEEVSVTSECPCAPHSLCTWLKSVKPIPATLTGVPTTVATLNGKVVFDHVNWGQAEDRITKARIKAQRIQPYYTTRNTSDGQHLYIYTNSELTESGNLQSVIVSGIFENPIDVWEFGICGEENNKAKCNPLDQEFILPGELQTQLFQMTLQGLMMVSQMSPGPQDILNNTHNDTKGPQVS